MKIKAIEKDGDDQITALYLEMFPGAAGVIHRLGGTLDDAKEVFQEAIIAYYEKSRSSTAAIGENPKAYLLGIVRNLYLASLSKEGRVEPLRTSNYTEGDPGEEIELPSKKKIYQFLRRAGGKCLDILVDFYYHNVSPADLAQKYGFSSGRSATVQKYKCMEKVRDAVREKSMSYADFME